MKLCISPCARTSYRRASAEAWGRLHHGPERGRGSGRTCKVMEPRFRQVTDLSAARRPVVGSHVSRLGAGIAFAIPHAKRAGRGRYEGHELDRTARRLGAEKRMVRAARGVEKVGPVGTKDRLRQNLLRAR